MKTVRVFIAILFSVFALSMTSYGETVLRVGVEEDKPLSFRAQGPKAGGFAVDVLEEICNQNGIRVEYVYSDLSGEISMLENGEIDVLTLGYSNERAERFKYIEEPLIENWGTVVSLKPSQRISDISGKKVAVVMDDLYAQNFKKVIMGIENEPSYIYVSSYEDVFRRVRDKTADYGIVSRFSMAARDDGNEYYETPVLINPVELRYAFRKDIPDEIYNIFDSGVKNMKSDRDSKYYEAIEKWFFIQERGAIPEQVVWFVSGLIAAVLILCILNLWYKDKIRKKEIQLTAKNKLLSEKNESIYKMNEKLSQDMDDLRKSKETIYKMAYYDQLTGLFNKNSLNMDMRNMCKQKDVFSIVFFDLDNFKIINDTMGFLQGDELLKKVSSILVRESDENKSLYRWSGDEFVFLCKGMDSEDEISKFCSNILKNFEEPITLKDMNFFPSASIGVSIFPANAQSHEELIKKANAALHFVKSKEKCGYKIYSEDITDEAIKKLELDAKLRSAVENDEIQAYFQPRVNAQNGDIVGMEALARWTDSDGKFISPASFIPLAEENGLVKKIGRAMLQKSCIQAKAWLDMGYELSVSVNLSSRQLEDEQVLEYIDESLKTSGLGSEHLELEITESSIIENMDSALSIIEKIRSRGIRVLLDDFGTGYSSLNYLRRMPIDTIKIDKSFMDMIFEGHKEEAITSYIISLSHRMGLTVVAEGVEKKEQVEFLREKGCDEIQGFFFSRPLTAEKFEKLLKEKAS